MSLPFFKTNTVVDQLQTKWKSELDPVLGNPMTNPGLLFGIPLVSGVNVINHLLGRTQQGWVITDINAAAMIFRSAPFNSKTLTLTSNAACTVDLMVF